MDEKYFWAFFIIALIAGAAIGIAYSNSTLTGYAAVNGKAEPALESFCIDDDGGYNFAIKGTCTDMNGIHYDECTGGALTATVDGKPETLTSQVNGKPETSTTQLKEWFCVQDTCASTIYEATTFGYEGCFNGAFVKDVSDAIAAFSFMFDGKQFPHCETTNDFSLDREDSIFFLTKCDRAIFVEGNRRKEVTLHGTFFDTARQEFVAHIGFKDFLGNTLCFEEDIITAVDDAGFAVDVLEIKSKSFNGETVETALVVIPDNFFEDFCFSQTQIIEGSFTNKKYVINDEVNCIQGLGKCTEAQVR